MPQKFEANIQLNTSSQQFNIYETDKTYSGYQGSVSLGNKSGDWSFWVNANHLDSQGQPMVFAIKTRETTTGGKVVTGGPLNHFGQPLATPASQLATDLSRLKVGECLLGVPGAKLEKLKLNPWG